MRWEHLVPSDFERAVRETGLCIVPTGSLERHGEHLPFGCDMIIAHTIACRAAEIEPAVVFPPWFMMQVHEAATFSGTVNFPPAFAIQALEHLLDSIAANGFKKILIVNGHGGNSHMLDYFAMSHMDQEKAYTFYQVRRDQSAMTEEERAELASLWESELGGHACEMETSEFMAACPGTTRLELTPEETVEPQRRFAELHRHGVTSPLWWYADYPENIVGDPRLASEEKGERALEIYSRVLARAIRAVKEDEVAPALRAEFLAGVAGKGQHEA